MNRISTIMLPVFLPFSRKIGTSLILWICLIAVSIQAQPSIGIRAGSLFSSYKHNTTTDAKSIIGIETGAFLNIPVYKALYVQPELTFLQKGGTLGFMPLGDLSVKTNQVEAAALIGYTFSTSRLFFFAHIGLFNGYVAGTPKDENPFITPFLSRTEKDRDWGVLAGAGFGVPVAGGDLVVEGRYRRSENTFRATTYGIMAADPDFGITLENRGWGISVGYFVDL